MQSCTEVTSGRYKSVVQRRGAWGAKAALFESISAFACCRLSGCRSDRLALLPCVAKHDYMGVTDAEALTPHACATMEVHPGE